MTVAAPFAISCPTAIRFGAGCAADIVGLLPDSPTRIVFVQGASGRAGSTVLADLRRAGHEATVVSCPEEPSVDTVNKALQKIGAPKHVIACGGGSVLDMGKALAALIDMGCALPDDFSDLPTNVARSKVRMIAVPTTAGTGAEVTANAVIDVPEKGAKISIRGPALIPDIAIIDPVLAQTAPPSVALSSGLDALTQVIESYTSSAATPFSMALCRPAIPLGLNALRSVMGDDTLTAWQDMCWVSLSSGLALANSGLGAAHGLASVLGAQLGAPHGAVCGRLLIPTLRMNFRRSDENPIAQSRLSDCMTDIATAFPPTDQADQLSGFDDWITAQNLPRLADFRMTPDRIVRFAGLGKNASSSQKNAVPLTAEDYADILQQSM